MRLVYRLLLFGSVIFCVACQRGNVKNVMAMQKVLNRFEYVGEGPDLPDGRVANHDSKHSTYPPQFVRGRQYIFHHKRNTVESWIAVQDSLKKNGAAIVSAPSGNVGLVYTTIGGPWYIIEFRLGGVRYSFQNHPAKELASGGLGSELEPQDFILRRE